MSRSSSSSFVGGGVSHAPLFTVSQWAEMEHQAMVFKYLKAGVPVPPELLAPLRSSLLFPHFLPHPSLTYASFCGKKIDPEPGRCRRTDGKKWRCSKEAHPDSKYCERHMNRGRYRSRKLVESQNTAAKSLSAAAASSEMRNEGRGNSGSFGNVPLGLAGSSGMQLAGNSGSICFGSDTTQLRMESIPYGIVKRGNRVLDGAEEHNFMLEASGSARSVGVDRTADDQWHLMTSRAPSNSSSETRNDCFLLNNNSQPQTVQNGEALTVHASMAKQQQQEYIGGEFGVLRSVKQDQHSLQPFFDEWPKSRDLVFDHSDLESNTTQLSMSNQMALSFFKER